MIRGARGHGVLAAGSQRQRWPAALRRLARPCTASRPPPPTRAPSHPVYLSGVPYPACGAPLKAVGAALLAAGHGGAQAGGAQAGGAQAGGAYAWLSATSSAFTAAVHSSSLMLALACFLRGGGRHEPPEAGSRQPAAPAAAPARPLSGRRWTAGWSRRLDHLLVGVVGATALLLAVLLAAAAVTFAGIGVPLERIGEVAHLRPGEFLEVSKERGLQPHHPHARSKICALEANRRRGRRQPRSAAAGGGTTGQRQRRRLPPAGRTGRKLAGSAACRP